MKSLRLLILLALMLTGCTPGGLLNPTATAVIPLPQPSRTPTPTITPIPPSATPTITPIPRVTFTRVPTRTEMPPISTFLPTTDPAIELNGTLGVTSTNPSTVTAFIPALGEDGLRFIGRGPKTLPVEKWAGPAVMWVRHTGYTPFKLSGSNQAGLDLGALASARGSYQGALPLDFAGGQLARLQMEAVGGWEVRLVRLAQAHPLAVPGAVDGLGNDVLAVAGLAGDLPAATLRVETHGARGLVIKAFGGEPEALAEGQPLTEIGTLVNANRSYQGSVPLPATTLVLVIQAGGEWHLEVTTP